MISPQIKIKIKCITLTTGRTFTKVCALLSLSPSWTKILLFYSVISESCFFTFLFLMFITVTILKFV